MIYIIFGELFHTCFISVIARYFSKKGQNVPLYRPLCKNGNVSALKYIVVSCSLICGFKSGSDLKGVKRQ